jgi:hypothetical protein
VLVARAQGLVHGDTIPIPPGYPVERDFSTPTKSASVSNTSEFNTAWLATVVGTNVIQLDTATNYGNVSMPQRPAGHHIKIKGVKPRFTSLDTIQRETGYQVTSGTDTAAQDLIVKGLVAESLTSRIDIATTGLRADLYLEDLNMAFGQQVFVNVNTPTISGGKLVVKRCFFDMANGQQLAVGGTSRGLANLVVEECWFHTDARFPPTGDAHPDDQYVDYGARLYNIGAGAGGTGTIWFWKCFWCCAHNHAFSMKLKCGPSFAYNNVVVNFTTHGSSLTNFELGQQGSSAAPPATADDCTSGVTTIVGNTFVSYTPKGYNSKLDQDTIDRAIYIQDVLGAIIEDNLFYALYPDVIATNPPLYLNTDAGVKALSASFTEDSQTHAIRIKGNKFLSASTPIRIDRIFTSGGVSTSTGIFFKDNTVPSPGLSVPSPYYTVKKGTNSGVR